MADARRVLASSLVTACEAMDGRGLLLEQDQRLAPVTPNRNQGPPPPPPARWLMLIIFSLNTACNGLMYSTEAAVEEPAARYYHVTVGKVLLLTDIFYGGYIPFVVPAMWLMTRPDGCRWAVIGGGLALTVGAGMRTLANKPVSSDFQWMEYGTGVISISTPLLLGCITQITSNWFPASERALATSVSVLVMQAGMLAAYVIPPLVVPYDGAATAGTGNSTGLDSGSGSSDGTSTSIHALGIQLRTFGYLQFAICATAAILAVCCFRTRPSSAADATSGKPPPSAKPAMSTQTTSPKLPAEQEEEVVEEAGMLESVQLCYCNFHFWVLSLVFGFATPIYWTLGQLIDESMGHPGSGWEHDQIYTCAAILQAASFPGFLLGGWLVDRTGRHQLVVNVSLVASLASLIVFTLALAKADAITGVPPRALYYQLISLCAACGFSFACFQPAALELAAECTYPAKESVSCSILYLNCQFAGIFYIKVADLLTAKDGSTNKVNGAFCIVLAVCTVAEMLLFRGKLRRAAARDCVVHDESVPQQKWAGTGWTPPNLRLSDSLTLNPKPFESVA